MIARFIKLFIDGFKNGTEITALQRYEILKDETMRRDIQKILKNKII